MKVLVVEEKTGQQGLLCESLQGRDCSVERVSCGREAIALASRQSYDLIILDLTLPSESSLLVLHEMRELNRESKILVLSAPEQIRDRVTALIQGADDYLVKPVAPQDLHSRVQSLTKRRDKPVGGGAPGDTSGCKASQRHRLFNDLLHLCQNANPGIELIISEVKLYRLICNAIAGVHESASRNHVDIPTPVFDLPDVLTDARWMELLLVHLLNHAIANSPANSIVDLDFDALGETGVLDIESVLRPDIRDFETVLTGLRNGADNSKHRAIDSLALARFCAESLNIRLQGRVIKNRRLQLQISGIRIA